MSGERGQAARARMPATASSAYSSCAWPTCLLEAVCNLQACSTADLEQYSCADGCTKYTEHTSGFGWDATMLATMIGTWLNMHRILHALFALGPWPYSTSLPQTTLAYSIYTRRLACRTVCTQLNTARACRAAGRCTAGRAAQAPIELL